MRKALGHGVEHAAQPLLAGAQRLLGVHAFGDVAEEHGDSALRHRADAEGVDVVGAPKGSSGIDDPLGNPCRRHPAISGGPDRFNRRDLRHQATGGIEAALLDEGAVRLEEAVVDPVAGIVDDNL